MNGYDIMSLLLMIPESIRNTGIVILILSIIEVTPIKLNPWKWLKAFIELPARLEKLEREFRDDRAFRWRTLIFNRARLIAAGLAGKGDLLRQEEWEETLDTITKYEHYCEDNPDFKNDKAVQTIEYIRKSYQYALDHNLFL